MEKEFIFFPTPPIFSTLSYEGLVERLKTGNDDFYTQLHELTIKEAAFYKQPCESYSYGVCRADNDKPNNGDYCIVISPLGQVGQTAFIYVDGRLIELTSPEIEKQEQDAILIETLPNEIKDLINGNINPTHDGASLGTKPKPIY